MYSRLGKLSIFLALVMLSGGPAMADTQNDRVTLDSGKLVLTFDTAGDRLSLTGISDGRQYEWLTDSTEAAPLWRLGFQPDKGVGMDVDSTQTSLASVKAYDHEAEFRWSVPLGESSAKVAIKVRLPAGNAISRWSLECRLPDGWRVGRAEFPLIPGIECKPGLKMAAPSGWGLEYPVKTGMRYDATYPSCNANMQFLAFYVRGHGLYIGAHDATASHKYFNVTADDDGADYMCMNWPALPAKSGGTYRVPFDAAVGVFDGGYWDAAQIYREFTFSTPWGKCGHVSRRPIPQWVKDTDLWLFSELTVEENLALREKAEEIFGIPMGFHWYRWHEIPHDVNYPNYFPTKPGFSEAVKEFQAHGWHVMPYINGRLSDPKSDFWAYDGGDEAGARQSNGDPYAEEYIKGVPLNVMCPYTDRWQETVADLSDRLITEIGVDGVYIDQIGAAAPVRCFDPDHGHQPGGGSFWVDGYRRMLDRVRAKLPEDGILATEENAEPFIDKFDLQLMANTPTITDVDLIPLFQSVYSGRSLAYGFQYPAWDDIVKSLPFRAKMARSFVWGAQVGWVRLADVTRPEAEKEVEFLRNLARCRRFGHDFLVDGRFLGMLNVRGIRGDNPRLKCDNAYASFGGAYEINLPSVLASAWLSQDGRLAIVMANMSDENQLVSMWLPLVQAGLASELTSYDFGPDGLMHTHHHMPPASEAVVYILGRQALILVYEQKT